MEHDSVGSVRRLAACGQGRTDQLRLYDALTPLFGDVGRGDLTRLFKSARCSRTKGGTAGDRAPAQGVRIRRDRCGVPHINGTTDADVIFGAGWAPAQDRGLLLERFATRAVAAVDAPGLKAIDLRHVARFQPSTQTEREMARRRRSVCGAMASAGDACSTTSTSSSRASTLSTGRRATKGQAMEVHRRDCLTGCRASSSEQAAAARCAPPSCSTACGRPWGRSRRSVERPAPAPGPGDPRVRQGQLPVCQPLPKTPGSRRRRQRLVPADPGAGRQRRQGLHGHAPPRPATLMVPASARSRATRCSLAVRRSATSTRA